MHAKHTYGNPLIQAVMKVKCVEEEEKEKEEEGEKEKEEGEKEDDSHLCRSTIAATPGVLCRGSFRA